jgi:hypothetical protein
MEWDGMGWNGMEWNGMEWNGMEQNRMGQKRMQEITISKDSQFQRTTNYAHKSYNPKILKHLLGNADDLFPTDLPA